MNSSLPRHLGGRGREVLRSATLSRPSGTVAEVVAWWVVSNPLCQDRRGGMEWVFTQIERNYSESRDRGRTVGGRCFLFSPPVALELRAGSESG